MANVAVVTLCLVISLTWSASAESPRGRVSSRPTTPFSFDEVSRDGSFSHHERPSLKNRIPAGHLPQKSTVQQMSANNPDTATVSSLVLTSSPSLSTDMVSERPANVDAETVSESFTIQPITVQTNKVEVPAEASYNENASTAIVNKPPLGRNATDWIFPFMGLNNSKMEKQPIFQDDLSGVYLETDFYGSSEMNKTDGRCPSKNVTTMNVTSGGVTWIYNYTSCVQEYTWTFFFPSRSISTIEFHYVDMLFKDRLEVLGVYPSGFLSERIFNESNQESLAPLIILSDAVIFRAYTSVKISDTAVKSSSFNISFTTQLSKSVFVKTIIMDSQTPMQSYTIYHCKVIAPLPEVIMCDGIRHCEDGEDEIGCAYTQEGCGDWFPYNDHCLKAEFIRSLSYRCGSFVPTAPLVAEDRCSEFNASLAVLPDSAGIEIAANLIRKSGFLSAAVAIRKFRPISTKTKHLYRFMWQWGGQGSSIAYEQQDLQRSRVMEDCGALFISPKPCIQPVSCFHPSINIHGYICMKPKPNQARQIKKPRAIRFQRASQLPDQFPTKECPDGSVVQIFHQCRWGQHGADLNMGWSPGQLPLFQCRLGPPVHYSLLCDGNDDCADRSDETSCQKPQFSPLLDSSFNCRNFQTVPVEKRCDGILDCSDGSDEEYCVSCKGKYLCIGTGCVPGYYTIFLKNCPTVPPSTEFIPNDYTIGSVQLDGFGMSILNLVSGKCAEGFYGCLSGLCIPGFLINNGEKDCTHGEDENIPTHSITCPGYYRCKGVGSCVHKKYLCDGVHHCPDKDDEMFCQLTCPQDQGCTCEGHAFTCSKMIDPFQHLHVRYLDLSHARDVSLENIHVMEHLFFLNLSFCHLNSVVLKSMPHVQTLDLSFNSLKDLASIRLHNLPGLLHLNLSYNPLGRTLSSMKMTTSLQGKPLNSIFNLHGEPGEVLNLKTLMLINTNLETIPNRWFRSLTKLQHLDLRDNALHSFNQELLWGLDALEVLFIDQSKLCCSYFHFSVTRCYAPVDELSSCSDLLGQVFFRVSLWTISVLAIVGNMGVLVYRLVTETHISFQASRLLLKNLCASDFLMGVYLMIIGIADIQFQGNYVAKETAWINSIACKIAGCLSFISSEVSAFLICLITLERVLVVCFPFKKTIHLGSRITIFFCCLIWMVGITLAAVPLISGMEFYGLNGICLPLPITRKPYSGRWYAFSIFIILNFVVFFFISVGQVLIYRAVRNARTACGSQEQEKDRTLARRLFVITFTDFCCWCPVGVMGLLAFHGIPIPGQVNVWTLIFVLPVNSALNPFLYTLNGLLEEWEKRRMKEREQRILGKLQTEIPKWQPSTVLRVAKLCLMSKKIDQDAMLKTWEKAINPHSYSQEENSSVGLIN